MTPYDYISADAVEIGDQIIYNNDPIEVTFYLDDDDSIIIKGYSHNTGDLATYILTPDQEVGLWSV